MSERSSDNLWLKIGATCFGVVLLGGLAFVVAHGQHRAKGADDYPLSADLFADSAPPVPGSGPVSGIPDPTPVATASGHAGPVSNSASAASRSPAPSNSPKQPRGLLAILTPVTIHRPGTSTPKPTTSAKAAQPAPQTTLSSSSSPDPVVDWRPPRPGPAPTQPASPPSNPSAGPTFTAPTATPTATPPVESSPSPVATSPPPIETPATSPPPPDPGSPDPGLPAPGPPTAGSAGPGSDAPGVVVEADLLGVMAALGLG